MRTITARQSSGLIHGVSSEALLDTLMVPGTTPVGTVDSNFQILLERALYVGTRSMGRCVLLFVYDEANGLLRHGRWDLALLAFWFRSCRPSIIL